MKIPSFIFLVLLLLPPEAWEQTRKPASIAELATYRGADRERVLYAGAKAEGKVVWYTSLAGGSYKEIVSVFEAKYPGVKVESFRAAGNDLLSGWKKKAKREKTSRIRLKQQKEALSFCVTGNYSVPMTHLISMLTQRRARSRPGRGLYIGHWPENPISALPTIKNLCPKR